MPLTPIPPQLRIKLKQAFMPKQVFYDPEQSRWRKLRPVFDILALTVSLIVVFSVYTALRSEPLPELLWPTLKRPFHALKEKEKERAKEKRVRDTVD